MYRFVYSFGLLLTSFILSDGRHTVFISQNGAKTYLPTSSESEVCMTPACVIAAADVLTSLDETVDPCDDFYNFACGGWMKRQEVSDDQLGINLFSKTQKDIERTLRDLIEIKYKSSDPQFVKMLKDFYISCLDLDNLEKEGSETLKKILRRLGGWPVIEGSQWDESTFDWVETLFSLRRLGYNFRILLNLYVDWDPKNPTGHLLCLKDPFLETLFSANLSLGLDDPEIAAYYRMMVKAAKLLGADESTAEKELLEVLRFEMALINISKIEKDENSALANFSAEPISAETNTFHQLQVELPQVPWLKIVNGLLIVHKVNENDSFVNGKPTFLVKFADLITSTDKRVIANYMMWRAVLESGRYLSEEWRDIVKVLDENESSQKNAEKPRWKQCLVELRGDMEIGVSSYYVRQYFKEESQDEAMIMMKYIRKEFLKILETNDWMDEKTREKAEEKANAIKAYIGYPKGLLNDTLMLKIYENLSITNDSYLENVLAGRKWKTDNHFSVLGEISTEMLEMSNYHSLMEVNAFYNPSKNSIGLPVGILHDVFYDKDKPKYMNFGVIGYIIGHEITHGFDNEGRKFDKDGNKVNWWDKKSDEHFRKKVKCIVDQYDNYTTDIGLKVNGEMTQGENIADNGGLKEAYLAYHTWTKDHGIDPLLPGVNYNQNQLFWLSAAHGWCSKYPLEKQKELLLIDEHSPEKFRIIGPMSNLAEFSNDFKCPPDAPMNRKYKCEVW